jgi:hypothetical protein
MRRAVFFSVLGAATATFLLGGTYALATNVNFILGSTANAPDALTAVVAKNVDGHGGLNGPMLRLTNNSTSSGATALALGVGSNRPPFTVNSAAKVAGLNADKLDGVDSAGFVQGSGKFLSASVQLPPDPGSVVQVLVYHAAPAFDVVYECPGDLATKGSLYVRNLSPLSGADLVSSVSTDPAPFHARMPANGATRGWGNAQSPDGSITTFTVKWFDGHVAQIWVSSFHLDGQSDPRDDSCYVTTTALVR